MKEKLTVVGTAYWRSYALYNAAARQERAGDIDGAEKLYVSALKADDGNRAARMNLGSLLLLSPENEQLAIAQLRRAIEDAVAAVDGGDDAVYYAASLRLASALYNAHDDQGALDVSTKLLTRVQAKLAELRKPAAITPRTAAMITRSRPTSVAPAIAHTSPPRKRALPTTMSAI